MSKTRATMTGREERLNFAWSALKYPYVFVYSESGKNANLSSLEPRRNVMDLLARNFLYIFPLW